MMGAPAPVPPPGAFKKELMQAKRRESEMAARLTALEGEVALARSTSQSQQTHADDLTDRLAVSAAAGICISHTMHTCSGSWKSPLSTCCIEQVEPPCCWQQRPTTPPG